MTVPVTPEIPASPVIEALRAALDAAQWMAPDPDGLGRRLIDAAQAVVREHDGQIAAIRLMLTMPRPTAEQIHAQLGIDQTLEDSTITERPPLPNRADTR